MIPWLDPHKLTFPAITDASVDADGLLAAGGDLTPKRIMAAYRKGIFPWFNSGEPILWWSPDPRTVVIPSQFHLSRSMQKLLRKSPFKVTFDHQFEQVMRACAAPRRHQPNTWISDNIIRAYTALHRAGCAHSVEVWQGEELVGGLYGIAIGRVFYGESMFSLADNASKTGFAHLVRCLQEWQFELIDCQVESSHLLSLGAINISRHEFCQRINQYTKQLSSAPKYAWSDVNPRWSPGN